MKKILFAFLFTATIIPAITFAQKVKIKKQNVYVDDSLYCKIKGQGLFDAIPGQAEFTIKSLADKELIFVKEAKNEYLTLTFLNSGAKMKIKKENTITFSDKKDILKKIYNANLLQGDSINTEVVRLFILKNDATEAYKEDIGQNTIFSGKDYVVLDRNTDASINIKGSSIMQDNKTIGNYKANEEIVEGVIKTNFSFYLYNNIKVATLNVENYNPAAANTILTLKDNQQNSVDELSKEMFFNKENYAKIIAEWLVKRGYL
jgi:hypothetical protein